jgi:hypothetical protein
MSPEAVELEIFIRNDYPLWRTYEAIEAAMAKKILKGEYNPELAIKGWMHIVDIAARQYSKKFGTIGSRVFNRAIRREIATTFEREFYRKHMGMRRR